MNLIDIYIAFFGIASQRYENRIDIIENRANSIFTQLGTDARKSALSRIADVQNYPCPVKPKILDPISVFRSIFTKDVVYTEMAGILQETIESWKKELNSADLYEASLEEADLQYANLEKANLKEAGLVGANLHRAYLVGALNLTIEQLSKVKTLYKARLDPELMEQVKEKYPHLLVRPKKEEPIPDKFKWE